jgi:tetratricopeptide (TPR) repeat protein
VGDLHCAGDVQVEGKVEGAIQSKSVAVGEGANVSGAINLDAEKVLPFPEKAVRLSEEEFGPDHPELATDLNNLATLYQAQGKYTEAEPLYERALVIREKALGPEQPEVAASLNSPALLYYDQGRYPEAQPL